MSKTRSLPKVISPDTSLLPVTYKAGMQLELQKFGDFKGVRQAILSEAMGEAELAQDSPAIEVTGLDLSVSEDRALCAIQILLDKIGYQGNVSGQQEAAPEWRWSGTLPRLSTSYSEYFEAYGLKPVGGRYQGHQRDEALEALEGLAKPRRIIFERKRWEGAGKKRRQLSDMIVVTKPLVNISKAYKGLEQDEAAQVRAGQDIPGRASMLVIDIGPLLVEGISDYFLLKPATLHQDIKALLGSRSVSRAVSLFIEWLLTLNLPKVSISRDNLATKLRLDYLIQQRKRSSIKSRLLEAIQTAQGLGYLLEWEEDAFGTYHFALNPNKMGRTPKYQPRTGENEDEKAGSLSD